jgi:Tfp pilus tip-associated adhesin PilY1
LDDITTNKNAYCADTSSTKKGWALTLTANEKVLAPLVAFNNVLLFTSFIPAAGGSDLCTKTGTAYLYAITIDSSTGYCNVGQGALDGGAVSIAIGTGIATGVTISFGPTGVPVTYTTISGAGGQEGKTGLDPYKPSHTSTKTNLIYWKDRRLQ